MLTKGTGRQTVESVTITSTQDTWDREIIEASTCKISHKIYSCPCNFRPFVLPRHVVLYCRWSKNRGSIVDKLHYGTKLSGLIIKGDLK